MWHWWGGSKVDGERVSVALVGVAARSDGERVSAAHCPWPNLRRNAPYTHTNKAYNYIK